MNNYFTLIYIAKHLKCNLKNAKFNFAITPFKNVLELFFIVEHTSKRIIFSTAPTKTAIFFDDYRPPKKSNIRNFFESLGQTGIDNIDLMNSDRLINFEFKNGLQLRFLLFGNSPNAFLINEDEEVIDAFKNPDQQDHRLAPQPKPPKTGKKPSESMKTKNKILAVNPQLPRNLLPHLIKQHHLNDYSVDEIEQFVQHITQILLENPQPRVLQSGEVCLWPKSIIDMPTEKTFDTVNECVKFAYRESMYLRQLSIEKGELMSFLDKQLKQHRTLENDLKYADKSLDRAEEYQKWGHILMANAHEGAPKQKKETLTDIYQPDSTVTIAVDPQYSFAENAQQYYEKANDAKRNYEESIQRLKRTSKKIEHIKDLRADLEPMRNLKDIRKWKKQQQQDLNELGWGREQSVDQKPYRTYQLGSYTLWVGRNAKSNDQLTSDAHKEDIWLHARGVSGSHVVIRMNNDKDYPQKTIILQAAAIAAYFSKARGNQYAPVMFTKKKYVRKPKGSGAGAVVVEREQVEMVEPAAPQTLKAIS